MPEVLRILLNVTLAVGATVGIFVAVNLLLNQATARFRVFATIVAGIIGAIVGVWVQNGGVVDSYPVLAFGMDVGPLDFAVALQVWPIVGAVLGGLLGYFVWAKRPPSLARRRRIDSLVRPIVFVAPALAFLGVSLVIPTIRTIYLSFRSKRGDEAVGLKNFRSVFGDERIFSLDGVGDILTSRLFVAGVVLALVGLGYALFRGLSGGRGIDLSAPAPVLSLSTAATLVVLAAVGSLRAVLWNNLFWVIFVTGFATVAGLAIAVLADRSRGENVAKSLIFMPMAISFVGASVIWRFVYAFTPPSRDQIGVLNAAWVFGGGEPQTWIQDQPWNTLFLIAIMIWIQTGFAMVVLSAAIKAVPTELLEAARVDGASEVQTFWRVTLPQIRTTVGVVITTLIILVLKVYDIVKVMTNGEFGTNVVANEMLDELFTNRNTGRASALAVLLFIAVLPLMIVNMRRNRREVAG
jgi:ABC-type sugar transport system permease subunit